MEGNNALSSKKGHPLLQTVSRSQEVETTLLYIQLAEAIFRETTDEFTVRVASKPDEIKALLEVGFEFVCEKDELLYFRKRK